MHPGTEITIAEAISSGKSSERVAVVMTIIGWYSILVLCCEAREGPGLRPVTACTLGYLGYLGKACKVGPVWRLANEKAVSDL